jgi:predicted ribonuclease YlaK
VALTGKAGSGKTLLALAAALHQLNKKSGTLYDKVMVARPPVPMNGYDMGFLPWDIPEKSIPGCNRSMTILRFCTKHLRILGKTGFWKEGI